MLIKIVLSTWNVQCVIYINMLQVLVFRQQKVNYMINKKHNYTHTKNQFN